MKTKQIKFEKNKKQKKSQNNNVIKSQATEITTGMKKWIDEYAKKFIDEKKLQAEIDDYMKNYDENKSKLNKEEKDRTNQPDEDGWITVTTKSRKANRGALTERNIQKLKLKQKKRQQKMELVSFYKFQAKDSKNDYILQLRKKFEEDKNQIEEMKKQRKFKPF